MNTSTRMKDILLIFTCFAIAVLAVACNQEPTTSQQLEKVKTETQTAAQNMKDYTFAQKADFVATMQGQLDALNKDLDQLSAKVEKGSDTAKAEAKPKLQALRDQAARLNSQLDDARNATEPTWERVKAGFQKGYGDFKDGFTQARQWVSDKVAP
jgi:chromosome segregation ATPase